MKKTLIISLSLLTFFTFGCKKDEATINPDKMPPQTPTAENMQLEPEKGDTIAIMTTNHGEIKILLYTDLAPETTKNFIELSKAGKYDDVIFHRVIKDFMIQTGDFENMNGTGGYTYKGKNTTLEDEFGEGLEHIKGAVSMANAGPDTGASQFFIVQADEGTSWLDGKHAIFGYVFDGMDVVDEIGNVKTGAADKPAKDVLIEKIEIAKFE